MNQPTDITRVRVTYTKEAGLRFIGHLDLQRLWERVLRRSYLPVRYSQGYHPRARLNLASALPLGFISQMELLDFWMDKSCPADEIYQRLQETTPPGLTVKAVEIVDLREDALQTRMLASEYEVQFYEPQNIQRLKTKAQDLISADSIIRTRRKKTYDLRPLILSLKAVSLEKKEPILWMRLRAESGATGRPDEVLNALGYAPSDYLVIRTDLILSEN